MHNKYNPHFKSTYADLVAIREAVVPVFARHGLAIMQGTNIDRDLGFHLETRVLHVSGQSIVFRFPLPPDPSQVQKIGSVITYARRYSYAAIAAIVAEDDLDGNETLPATNGGGAVKGSASPADKGGHFL